MTDVLVLGDLNPDLILRGDVVPRFGQAEQLLSSADLVIGGSGAIAAHGLARLGRATMLGAVTGADAFGDLMDRMLAAGGVDTRGVARDPDLSTGVTVVLATESDRAVLTHLGAISSLTGEQASATLELAIAEGARHLHVSSFFLLPALAAALPELLATARSHGLTTSLDTNFDPAERWEGLLPVLAHLDLLLPNETEVVALAGPVGAASVSDAEAAATVLSARGPTVVVKRGAEGALLVAPDGSVQHQPAVTATPVDTTGAGDTFDAAYLDSLLGGLPTRECLRRAVTAGALAVQAAGGTAGQPSIEELRAPGRDRNAPRD